MMCIIVYDRMGQSVKIDVKTRWITTIPNDFKKKVNANKETQRNEFECREKCEQQQKKTKNYVHWITSHRCSVLPRTESINIIQWANNKQQYEWKDTSNRPTSKHKKHKSSKNTARKTKWATQFQPKSVSVCECERKSRATIAYWTISRKRNRKKTSKHITFILKSAKLDECWLYCTSGSMCFESPVQYAPYANPSELKSYSEKSYWLPSFRENIK